MSFSPIISAISLPLVSGNNKMSIPSESEKNAEYGQRDRHMSVNPLKYDSN